jgi:hypothetical protein
MVEQIHLHKIISDKDVKAREGSFFDESDFTMIVDRDVDVWTDEGRLLFKFRKSVVKYNRDELPLKAVKKYLAKSSSNRGIASGKLNSIKFKNGDKLLSPDRFKSRILHSDGSISKQYIANTTHSMIAGFFDAPNKCRLTAFSQHELEPWRDLQKMIKVVSDLYQTYCPDEYDYQLKYSSQVPDYCIDDTIFTTVTLNLNWQTALHRDAGDLANGYSAITVIEEGLWTGAYLGYPQYGIAINIREWDLLIMDPHQYHCNTPLYLENDGMRISVVYYFREGIMSCKTEV